MPMHELLEWQEFAALEPWGSHFDDLRAGLNAAAVYNVNRDAEKRPEAFKPLDFTPWNSLTLTERAPVLAGDGLDREALSRLIDAQIFGKT